MQCGVHIGFRSIGGGVLLPYRLIVRAQAQRGDIDTGKVQLNVFSLPVIIKAWLIFLGFDLTPSTEAPKPEREAPSFTPFDLRLTPPSHAPPLAA